MTGDPEEVIDRAERRKETIREHYLPAVEWFLENGGLDPRTEVVADLAAHLDVDREIANLVVGHLVSDVVDPVQQVVDPIDGTFVGVIDHVDHEGRALADVLAEDLGVDPAAFADLPSAEPRGPANREVCYK